MDRSSRPARTRLTADDIGAWLFRCNPRNTRLEVAGRVPVESRCAVPSYRLDLIRPGDPVVLWLTGPARATPPPGIWMAGYATGEVCQDPNEPARTRVHLVEMTRLPVPLPRDRLREHPDLAELEVIRQPFGPNPSYLTRAEQQAVQDLIGGWPGTRRDAGDGADLTTMG